jgi:hypothetical protein
MRPDATGCDRMSNRTGRDRMRPDATGCDRMRPDATGCDRMRPDVLRPDATGCDRMRPDATGCDRMRPDATGCDRTPSHVMFCHQPWVYKGGVLAACSLSISFRHLQLRRKDIRRYQEDTGAGGQQDLIDQDAQGPGEFPPGAD